ncbi:MAG: hypothetical protein U0791_24260 [Gemmataceae bacterium]
MNDDDAKPDSFTPPVDAERWVLVVRAEPRQEKRWLKVALRGYGIRCESASATTLVEQLEASRAEVLRLTARLEQTEARLARRHRRSRCNNVLP